MPTGSLNLQRWVPNFNARLADDIQRLKGPVGIFLTSHPVQDTIEWFDSWTKKEYTRMGARSTREIVLPAGEFVVQDLSCTCGGRCLLKRSSTYSIWRRSWRHISTLNGAAT